MKKREEEARKGMEKIISLGKQKGFLTYDEVNELLPQELSSSEEIDRLFEMLGNEDIQIIESDDEKAHEKTSSAMKEDSTQLKEEALQDQLKSEERFLPLDDPVKMYLKQMGSISLLSRENEIESAKRIEEAEERFKRAALA
ncbi:MAG: RNA polymerase sigma factor RpoD, partial [Candidatus Omnitrophica bacterium]|nr:RNA polymerase sigma factor RpoD [Candidatus Omnitrophota bacterium]